MGHLSLQGRLKLASSLPPSFLSLNIACKERSESKEGRREENRISTYRSLLSTPAGERTSEAALTKQLPTTPLLLLPLGLFHVPCIHASVGHGQSCEINSDRVSSVGRCEATFDKRVCCHCVHSIRPALPTLSSPYPYPNSVCVVGVGCSRNLKRPILPSSNFVWNFESGDAL